MAWFRSYILFLNSLYVVNSQLLTHRIFFRIIYLSPKKIIGTVLPSARDDEVGEGYALPF